MSGVTWTKFFWADWESDAALRLCSLAAQGLWMRMLCVAASHDPIGYVCIAGRPLGVTDLARLTGASETEADVLLADLTRNGVCSRDGKGRIYSRRMVRDAKLSAIARKNGKNGGNPSLRKQRGNGARDNPPLKPPLKTHKPIATIQEKEPPSVVARASRISPDWRLSAEDRAYALSKGLADVELTAEGFHAYWTAKAGREAIKIDWAATWRQWVVNEVKTQPRQRSSTPIATSAERALRSNIQ